MVINNIYKLLDKLEVMILKGVPIPITPFVITNHEKLIDNLDKIRASIPGEIQEAHTILKRREEIQLDAQRRANQILAESQEKASSILSESELLKAVQSEAEKIRSQVISECETLKRQTQEEAEILRNNAINESIHIREGADKYAEAVLCSLNKDLEELLGVVENGQKHLAKVKAESLASMTSQKVKIQPSININQFNNQRTLAK